MGPSIQLGDSNVQLWHMVLVLGYVLFLGMPILHLVDSRGVFDVA